MKKVKLTFGTVLCSIIFITCTKDEVVEDTPVSCVTDYTYDADAAKIFQANCTGCHTTGGTSPNLTTFSDVVSSLQKVKKEAITDKTMPPSGALSDEDIKILNCWIEQGNPEK